MDNPATVYIALLVIIIIAFLAVRKAAGCLIKTLIGVLALVLMAFLCFTYLR